VTVFAFIGFGELGSSLAEGLARSGANVTRAYVPERSEPAAVTALESRLARSGTGRCRTLEEAVAGANAVLSVVPASAARTVAEQCAPLLAAGAYYVDLAATAVADKELAAVLVGHSESRYVDAAVLGTVAASGFAVPIVASGPGAEGWKKLVEREGLIVDVLDAPAGHATLLKLLRSVYMKGRDALIVEMMLAARHHGLEDHVARSIRGPGEEVAFDALAERVLCALAVHADRRADELAASGEVVRASGLDPVMSSAGSRVLRSLAALGLRDAFDHRRPSNGAAVLAMIEELSGELGRSSNPEGPDGEARA
jgi:3-hydroxyisobutyrate dehydrogenase-like beta-hydroxyacid dehydrogenase